MGSIIPFFYYDLFARVAPGALVIALLDLVSIRWPKPWTEWSAWLHSGGSAQTVLLPIVYGGIVYIIGLGQDVLLSWALWWLYRRGFRRATLAYHWCTPVGGSHEGGIPIDRLSKWSFDCYLIRTALDLPTEQPHALRFHAEAKFFVHSAFTLLSFVLFGCIDHLLKLHLIESMNFGWWVAIAIFIPLLFIGARKRALRRANQILSYIDHFREAKTDPQLTDLQGKLQKWQSEEEAK